MQSPQITGAQSHKISMATLENVAGHAREEKIATSRWLDSNDQVSTKLFQVKHQLQLAHPNECKQIYSLCLGCGNRISTLPGLMNFNRWTVA